MNYSLEKKEEYWKYFISHKTLWFPRTTLKILEKNKEAIFQSKYLWDDLLLRHGGLEITAEEFAKDKYKFEHGWSNFGHDIMEIMRIR